MKPAPHSDGSASRSGGSAPRSGGSAPHSGGSAPHSGGPAPRSDRPAPRRKPAPPRGLRPRLIVAFLLVAAVSALVTAALTFRQARQSILDRAQHSAVSELRLQTTSLAPSLPADPNDDDLRAFTRQLDRAAGSRDWHTAVSRDGKPLIGTAADDVSGTLRDTVAAHHDAAFFERVDHGAAPRLIIGMPVGYGSETDQDQGQDQDQDQGQPTGKSGKSAGKSAEKSADKSTGKPTPKPKPSGVVVYAALPLDRERTDISALITAAWAGAIPALAFAVVPALFAARRVLRPVRRLRTAAEKITEGALDTRLDAEGKDELAALTGTFNTMAGALERNDTKLRRMEANARRFAADVTHELRTPLAAMAAVTDALDEDARSGRLPADTAEAVLLISDETRKLTTMVEDLMEMSRFDAGAAHLRSDDVDLRTLIRKTLQLRGWHESPDVITEFPGDDLPGGGRPDDGRPSGTLPDDGRLGGSLPDDGRPGSGSRGSGSGASSSGTPVRVDARRLDVVLANLIGNALRHGAAPVTVRAETTPHSLVITIADSGPGIPDEVLAHVFDRFYKADTARTRSAGSGLGLAIAAENVRLHHGTLTAANLPEGGAVFTVTLPQPPPSPQPPPEEGEPS
ncbi:HAMP domain-containing sensor histidine kinase [Streptomyces varsoviensis]|uniref:HAMP domain-containing sensor histidine kinase n=1 Tax=Streptomyces varsoviensis TaxID=67373 RepID=UPI001FDEA8BA|nr:HAMP domain-containing sensor histidine kinase [Streptomyces varsoviensis]